MDSEGKEKVHERRRQKRDKGYYAEVLMKIRIISWNVRGVNDSEKSKLIKAFLKSHRVDLVCLQETKLKGASTDLEGALESGGLLTGLLSMQQELQEGSLYSRTLGYSN